MCAVSVIYDMFAKQPDEWFLANPYRITLFHTMVEDAKQFDLQTDQPNCADPDKDKLEARIAELESQLRELKHD